MAYCLVRTKNLALRKLISSDQLWVLCCISLLTAGTSNTVSTWHSGWQNHQSWQKLEWGMWSSTSLEPNPTPCYCPTTWRSLWTPWTQWTTGESRDLHRLRSQIGQVINQAQVQGEGIQFLQRWSSSMEEQWLHGQDPRGVLPWAHARASTLAAVGGAAEGIYIARLWRFLTNKDVITDSSSCRAFSERQGVGRLNHIDTKHLWLQQKV